MLGLLLTTIATYQCSDESCGRRRQFSVSTLNLPGLPAQLAGRAIASEGWLVLMGKLFCPRCAALIEDSLDLRPYGPDADIIRGAIDQRALAAKMEVQCA